jgi:hypothetical protein|tara:strand:+ start:323 stop:784 length:462 start_codon:yes stop_codon:yes gene_type:complete
MTRPSELIPQKYEVVKLKTGSELVGMVRESAEGLHITLPMICQLTVQNGIQTLATFYPYAPLSEDSIVLIPSDQVIHRSSMNEQFIPFYDEASSRWLEMVEQGTIPLTNKKIDNHEIQRQYLNKVMTSLSDENYDEFEEDFELFDEEDDRTIH